MAKLYINKSIKIDAPLEKVFNTINDFHHWTAWSPWLIMEPEVKVDVAEDGKSYSWMGNRTGEGKMKVLKEVANESVDYDLNFIKPFKSNAKVRFETASVGGSTQVNWIMDSSLPFFMFFMKKSMTAFIGSDYERGLRMLKDYVEKGQVNSTLDFKGTSNFPGCQFVGIKTSCPMDQVGQSMEEDFTALFKYFESKEDLIAGAPFSVYHNWDMVKKEVSYTSALPVKEFPSDLPAKMITGALPSTKTYAVSHKGSYDHLGNAWSTMMNLQRSKTFKMNKKIHPFEVYLNDPDKVDDKELLTEVHFAVK